MMEVCRLAIVSLGWYLTESPETSSDDGSVATAITSSPADIHVLLNEVKSNSACFTFITIKWILNRFLPPDRALKNARTSLARAQKETQDTFAKYKSFVDSESKALEALTAAEERRDALRKYQVGLAS